MTNKEPIPTEIKYGKIDTKGLLAFMKKINVDKGHVITLKQEKKTKNGWKNDHHTPSIQVSVKLTQGK